jgi:integrase
VKLDGNIYYFDITPDPALGKRLKNKASKRRVPVHAHLIELGFSDYVEKVEGAKAKHLLPKPKNTFQKCAGRETAGDWVSKWFTRIRDAAKVSGRKTLHSFRHTVVTRLVGLGVPEDIRKLLIGHADEDVHGATYVHRDQIPLALLRDNLNKLDFRSTMRNL